MTCAHVHDVAAELALGALTGRERASAIGHLEQCRACREDVRQLIAAGLAAYDGPYRRGGRLPSAASRPGPAEVVST